jgi:hypothetical protein
VKLNRRLEYVNVSARSVMTENLIKSNALSKKSRVPPADASLEREYREVPNDETLQMFEFMNAGSAHVAEHAALVKLHLP